MSSALSGLSLFLGSVLPAILPALILTGAARQAGAFGALGRHAEGFMRIWLRCPGEGAGAALTALLCGTPAGSKAIGALYADGVLDRGEATRLASAATTVSPAFILGVAGALSGGGAAGALLLCAHAAGAFLNGLLYRRYEDGTRQARASRAAPLAPLDAVMEGIREGASAIWVIGAVIVTCAAATGASSALLPGAGAWLVYVTEMTLGARAASALPLAREARLLIIQAVLSLGGLSVWAQALSMAGGAVNARVFMLSKVTHAALSTGICGLLLPLLGTEHAQEAVARAVWPGREVTQLVLLMMSAVMGVAGVVLLLKRRTDE